MKEGNGATYLLLKKKKKKKKKPSTKGKKEPNPVGKKEEEVAYIGCRSENYTSSGEKVGKVSIGHLKKMPVSLQRKFEREERVWLQRGRIVKGQVKAWVMERGGCAGEGGEWSRPKKKDERKNHLRGKAKEGLSAAHHPRKV